MTPFLNFKIMATISQSLLSSGLGAGLGIAGNLIGMELQNQHNEYLYNHYMSPRAQMAQMKAAGINPNAAAQGIAGSSSSIAPAASAADGAGVAGSLADLIGNSFNTALGAENTKANTHKVNSETKGQDLQNDFNEQSFEQRLNAIAKDNGWKDEQIKQMQAFNKYADQLYNWNAQKAEQDYKNAEKQWYLFESEIKKNEAETKLAEAQEGLTQQETKESAARTAKTWKEVEFQKWWNNYCTENNMQPDSPEAEYIRNKIIANGEWDSLERDEAREWCKNYEEAQEDIASAKAKAVTENDPEKLTIKQFKDDYDHDVKSLDERISSLQKQLNEYYNGKKDNLFHTGRNTLEHELKTLRGRKQHLREEYLRNVRRLRTNESTSIFSVSRSE